MRPREPKPREEGKRERGRKRRGERGERERERRRSKEGKSRRLTVSFYLEFLLVCLCVLASMEVVVKKEERGSGFLHNCMNHPCMFVISACGVYISCGEVLWEVN